MIMKNIHILPTDKPSRLFLNKVNKKLLLEDISNPNLKKVLPSGTYQNIYITSDEEIKGGNWVLNISNDKIFKQDNSKPDTYTLSFWRKIILTTDQDLIKDGVQAIDDEFLEWFVKNPSCEEVEVVFNNRGITGTEKILKTFGEYKIIIPKEKVLLKQFKNK